MAGWRRFWFALSSALVMHACAPEPRDDEAPAEHMLFVPSEGAMSGYYPVRIALEAGLVSDAVEAVRFGPIAAYNLSPVDSAHLEVWVQGSSKPGPVDVEVDAGGATYTLSAPFMFEAPRLDGFQSMHAFGASLTQGTQRGLPTQWSVQQGPAAQMARRLGLYFPLPMPLAEGFQEMTPDLIGAPPYCQPPALDAYQTDQALALIPELTDPDTGDFSFRMVRVDPDLETHNVSVGGSRVGEIMEGPKEGDIPLEFLSHMVYEPWGTIGDPVAMSQLEMLQAASPELIVSFDLLGNDLIDGMIDNADFKLTGMTPLDTYVADIERLVSALAATGAEVFLANLPNPVDLPFFRAKRARLAEEGLSENADLVFAAIDEGTQAANARLNLEAERHLNVHVVDLASQMRDWIADGVEVGEERLWVEQYGGLVGLDGLHFSDTAYALVANAMLRTINSVLDAEVPLIDVGAVWAQDRERPEALLAFGLEVSACQPAD